MRILFLSHYFPPEGNAPANRTFDHCKEWVQAGHDVHVITCIPSHPRGVPYDGYQICQSQSEMMAGIHVHRIWTYLAANKGFARRTLNYLSYMPSAILKSLTLGKFDVIVATSPQFFTAVAGFGVSKIKKTPWIFELRDIWPESIRAVGSLKNEKILGLLEKLELFLYRDSSSIVCVTQSFMENLSQRGISKEKLKCIPNGVNPDAWHSTRRIETRSILGVADNDIVVAYIGTVGLAHGIGTVIECAKKLRNHTPHIKFAVVGDGADLDSIKSAASAEQLENLIFTGMIPGDQIRDYMAATDISLVLLKKSKLFTTVLPSKMFEAMAAQKPIILGVEGEAERTLMNAKAGISVAPENSEAIVNAIRRMATDKPLREKFGKNGKHFVSKHFNRRVLAGELLAHLEKMAM